MNKLIGILLVVWLTATAGAQVRVWKDSSGQFEVRAELISSDGENVTLLKEDGTETVVPIERLSETDRGFLVGHSTASSFMEGPLWAKLCERATKRC